MGDVLEARAHIGYAQTNCNIRWGSRPVSSCMFTESHIIVALLTSSMNTMYPIIVAYFKQVMSVAACIPQTQQPSHVRSRLSGTLPAYKKRFLHLYEDRNFVSAFPKLVPSTAQPTPSTPPTKSFCLDTSCISATP